MMVSVTTSILTRDGSANVWWPAICDEASIADIWKRLVADRVLYVVKLETRIENGRRIIVGKVPTILTLNGLSMVQPVHLQIEPENETGS